MGRRWATIEVFHLFFADDTLIFCQQDLGNMLHLICVLMCFHTVSGLKINLHKSEMARIGGIGDFGSFAMIMGCKEVKFPFKYLGLPLGARYKDQMSWEPVIELFERRFAGWKKKFPLKRGKIHFNKKYFGKSPNILPINNYYPR